MMGTDVAGIQKEGDADQFRQGGERKGVNVRKAADGEERVATEAETLFENQRTMRREALGSESRRSLGGEGGWFETRGRKKKSGMSPEVSKGGLEARGTRRTSGWRRGGGTAGGRETTERPAEQVGATCCHLLWVFDQREIKGRQRRLPPCPVPF